MRPACPPYAGSGPRADSMINDSHPPVPSIRIDDQHRRHAARRPDDRHLPAVGAQRSGALLKITIGDQTTYGGAVVVRRGGYVGSITVISTLPVSSDLLSALAPRVDAEIRHVATTAT
jgi:hypothetical protein